MSFCLLCRLNVSIVSDGAAEEAGLMVGDYVLAVNGTDVTSIPHSEAAHLARQGMLVSKPDNGSNHATHSWSISISRVMPMFQHSVTTRLLS